MSTTRQLFGGAITAETAINLIDASDVRQVPDTQEVFMYPDSNVSIILEILQRVEPSHFNDAIRFHFDSLAHDNSARSATIESVSVVPNDRGDETPSAIVLKGVQMVPKFNHTTPDKVEILMALFRVESKGIDLVLTFNVPFESVDEGLTNDVTVVKANADFDTFVRSLRIVDFGVFA
ncbi:Mog1p/PsbP-like protein [Pholiota conissans]|uniref:Mog1p/PsbP-like protein n=1 Tax=Pholiota conissans TaxID=109636 RepID=A0A9P5ZAW8_9AGAR|nr:Mog1p/PsbP-like protein [Pholiota conissans]